MALNFVILGTLVYLYHNFKEFRYIFLQSPAQRREDIEKLKIEAECKPANAIHIATLTSMWFMLGLKGFYYGYVVKLTNSTPLYLMSIVLMLWNVYMIARSTIKLRKMSPAEVLYKAMELTEKIGVRRYIYFFLTVAFLALVIHAGVNAII